MMMGFARQHHSRDSTSSKVTGDTEMHVTYASPGATQYYRKNGEITAKTGSSPMELYSSKKRS